jgi:alkanesulfonate monooxygenase SsuD/methylene tetrahydromethanopterin reductase-like flavin-dependent oxidoreductase (luciferase family)
VAAQAFAHPRHERCLLPERNPIETAKAAATLDMYSGGRLMLGVGAGWFPEEAAIMGVDFKRRWRHLRECVEAMRELWSKPEASYAGEIIKFPAVRLFPKPVQKPYPPIFLGAHDPGPALKRVARWRMDGCRRAQSRKVECIPEIADGARENGRDPPDGISRCWHRRAQRRRPTCRSVTRRRQPVIMLAGEMGARDGVEVVGELAPMVERGAQI